MAEKTNTVRRLLEELQPNVANPVSRKWIRAEMERRWAGERKKILLDLANLSDDSCNLFRRRHPRLDVSIQEDDQGILGLRDQLQKLWRGEDHPLGWILQNWTDVPSAWRVVIWRDGAHSVVPNYTRLSLSLAIAASDWGSKMAVCDNPNCPQKYFLKGRKTQRFCERPACSAYGQREHKRKWWTEHSRQLKRKPQRIRKSRAKARGSRGR